MNTYDRGGNFLSENIHPYKGWQLEPDGIGLFWWWDFWSSSWRGQRGGKQKLLCPPKPVKAGCQKGPEIHQHCRHNEIGHSLGWHMMQISQHKCHIVPGYMCWCWTCSHKFH